MKSASLIASTPFLSILVLFVLIQTPSVLAVDSTPAPTRWPEQFHAILFANLTTTGKLQINDVWYDWPNGRNVNIIQKQLGELLYDIEWNNGTSFYYTLGKNGECLTRHFEVGIPRPNWMDGSIYLGMVYTDGILCHLWQKLDFIWYYEDVASKRPVRWDFYDGNNIFSLFHSRAYLPLMLRIPSPYDLGSGPQESDPFAFQRSNGEDYPVDKYWGELRLGFENSIAQNKKTARVTQQLGCGKVLRQTEAWVVSQPWLGSGPRCH